MDSQQDLKRRWLKSLLASSRVLADLEARRMPYPETFRGKHGVDNFTQAHPFRTEAELEEFVKVVVELLEQNGLLAEHVDTTIAKESWSGKEIEPPLYQPILHVIDGKGFDATGYILSHLKRPAAILEEVDEGKEGIILRLRPLPELTF